MKSHKSQDYIWCSECRELIAPKEQSGGRTDRIRSAIREHRFHKLIRGRQAARLSGLSKFAAMLQQAGSTLAPPQAPR